MQHDRASAPGPGRHTGTLRGRPQCGRLQQALLAQIQSQGDKNKLDGGRYYIRFHSFNGLHITNNIYAHVFYFIISFNMTEVNFCNVFILGLRLKSLRNATPLLLVAFALIE